MRCSIRVPGTHAPDAQVVRTGHPRDTKMWCRMDYTIKTEIGEALVLSVAEFDEKFEACDDTATPIWVWSDEFGLI
jgi:hypothetical protein